MASRRKGRIAAFQALYAYDITPDSDLDAFLWTHDESKPEPEWVNFSRLLFRGTLEQLEEVDKRISDHLEHWEISRVQRIDLAILRMSVYALCFQKSIPARVTIDEAVHLARDFGSDESYRFVNGVLDSIFHSLDEVS